MKRVWTSVLALMLSMSCASAEIGGEVGMPVSLSRLGIRDGMILSLRCDADASRSWLIGDVISQTIKIDVWGANIRTPARWQIQIPPGHDTWFKLKAVGPGAANAPRYLSLRPARAPSGREPYLSPYYDEAATSWQLYYLFDNLGKVHFFGLKGFSWSRHPQGERYWLNCDPATGATFIRAEVGTRNLVAWRLYFELPGY